MAHDEFSGLDQLVSTGALSLGSPATSRSAKPILSAGPPAPLKRHDVLSSSSPVVRQAVTANNAARIAAPPVGLQTKTQMSVGPNVAAPTSSHVAAPALSVQATSQAPQAATPSASPMSNSPMAKGIIHTSRQSKGQTPMSQDPNATVTEQQLNFVAKAVAAAGTGTATAKPQNAFRPTRLVVPSNIGPFFTINNLRIGTDSQFVNTVEAPALVYAENAVGTAFVLGVANPGIDITIDVVNTDAAVHDFRASMFGQVWK